MAEYAHEDVGNIVLLEHVNVQVPDQAMAMLFYIVGLGLTRDPYLNVGLNNMWANVGEQQFHLPTRPAQVIRGHIGLVVPDLEALEARLQSVDPALKGSQFSWSRDGDLIQVSCPWGNHFRCFGPGPRFGDMALGIPYVEFLVASGKAARIASFYERVFGAPVTRETNPIGGVAAVGIGRNQSLIFKETDGAEAEFDGHHIAIYVANFSGPYNYLKTRGLISEEVRNHQFRFKQVIDPGQEEPLYLLEHEVRSLHHPMFKRNFVNRDPEETTRRYRRGREALVPYMN